MAIDLKHPLVSMHNRCKENLDAGACTYGYFLICGNSMVAETMSTLPIDWLIVDMEASPISKEGAMHVLQSLNGSHVTPFIRVPYLNQHYIEHALDIGARGILVPKVNTAQEAHQAVDACRYPPHGSRGINPVRASAYFANLTKYLSDSNEVILCMVQIETALALDNLEEIVSTNGIDVVFVGCGDLASSLGQPGVVTGARMEDAIQRVLTTTVQAGKTPGIFAYSLDLARYYQSLGYKFIAIGNDIKALREEVIRSVGYLRNN